MTEPSVVACPHCGKKNRVPAAATGRPRCGACHRDLPWVVDAADASFAEIVERSELPVLVDLWAPWCGPCRAVSPALENIAQNRAGQLKLVKVNVDESPALAERFQVRGIPTLLLFDRDTLVAQRTGAAPEPALQLWVDRSLPPG